MEAMRFHCFGEISLVASPIRLIARWMPSTRALVEASLQLAGARIPLIKASLPLIKASLPLIKASLPLNKASLPRSGGEGYRLSVLPLLTQEARFRERGSLS